MGIKTMYINLDKLLCDAMTRYGSQTLGKILVDCVDARLLSSRSNVPQNLKYSVFT